MVQRARIRKIAQKAGLASLLTVNSCGVEDFEMSLWGEYGAFTETTQRNVRDRIKEIIDAGKCIDYDGTTECEGAGSVEYEGAPQEMFSGVTAKIFADQHAYEKERDRKTRTPTLKNYSFRIVGTKKELQKNCSEFAGACHKSDVPGIVTSARRFCNLVGTIGHEGGHGINGGDLEEMSSKAWEAYYPIKFFIFERELGSICLAKTFDDLNEEPIEWLGAREHMYEEGGLLAEYMLAECSGDLECALDRIRISTNSSLKSQLYAERFNASNEIRAEYGLNHDTHITLADQAFYFRRKALKSGGFINYLVGKRGHMDHSDAVEVRDYLLIRLHYVNLGTMNTQAFIDEKRKELLDTFVANENHNNPYFKAFAIDRLTPLLFEEMKDIIDQEGEESHDAFELAQRIIDMNANYPCELVIPPEDDPEFTQPYKDPFQCPSFVRDIESKDILSYQVMMNATIASGEPQKQDYLVEKSKAYVEKYYPGFELGSLEDFDSEFQPKYELLSGEHTTSTLVPQLMFEAGLVLDSKEGGDNCAYALRFFTAAVAAECIEDPLLYNQMTLTNCQLSQQYAQSRLTAGCISE